MRKLLILLILLSGSICYSQTYIWGKYVCNTDKFQSIELKPDYKYLWHSGFCGLFPVNDTGIFKINADTILLFHNDASLTPKKFLFITHQIKESNNDFCYWVEGALAEIYKSDTILSPHLIGWLSSYEALLDGSFIKTEEYDNDGKLLFKIKTFNETIIITYYYPSGQIKLISKLYKGKKSGDWYFFDIMGNIFKIETYKRNKIKG